MRLNRLVAYNSLYYKMNDTTCINDLGVFPAGGDNSTNNMKIQATETYSPQIEPLKTEELDPESIQLLISGVQEATLSGATRLPSRDIPMQPTEYTTDPHTKTNYIPPSMTNDYIEEYADKEQMIKNYRSRETKRDLMEGVYDELQYPLLLALLYFLFQLPAMKKFLFRYLPVLFLKDGNMNIFGYVFTSMLFGLIYYISNKLHLHH